MFRRRIFAVMSVVCVFQFMAGCSADPDQGRGRHVDALDQFQLVGEPDFDWLLSGDARVAPLQVFSDNWRIWLQWRDRQPIPSVLVLDQGNWHLTQPKRHGKFSVLEGNWQQIRFQGGKLRADARRAGYTVRRAHRVSGSHRDQAPASSHARPAEHASSQTSPQIGHQNRFVVEVGDQTIRQTLGRWAREHHWYFDNSHWTVPVDLPVTARAEFYGGFVEAVRALLSATQVAGRPLQPCFYANHVLRVISANEVCDPSIRTESRA